MTVDTARISELLDEAIDAVNTGDLATAHDLAERVLHDDAGNQEASELLATEGAANGELRRLTILACDLVGSTELSERLDPERYRTLVNRYQVLARSAIEDRYEGHIISVKGDGFLSLFGYPNAHEDDTYRAVRTAVELCAAMDQLSGQAQRAMGEAVAVRIGIHRGLVFIDLDQDDVYGLAANLAARTATLAEPGSVVMTEAVRRLVDDRFDVVAASPQVVKGVSEPVQTFALVGERNVPSGRAFAAPLVGRDDELSRLRLAWDDAKGGVASRPQAVLIRGEPGIGKSRLAQALVTEVRAEDATVLELAGSPFHADAGFHPVQVLLEVRSGIERDMDAGERLARLRDSLRREGTDPDVAVPWLAPILGLPPESGYQPVEAEGRKLSEDITDVVLRYLVGGFGDGPGVLLVEDLQWIDDSTTNLIEQLRARGPGQILVVVTARPDGRLTAETEIEIGPLAEADRLALVDAVDTLGLSEAARRSLAQRSDGIPLYVEELVRGWESGQHEPDDATVDAVPDALYESLLARLPSTDAGIIVTGAAATVGRHIDRQMLAGVLDLDAAVLERELEALIADSILVPTEQYSDVLGFRHELLREVAYELQPPATRRRIHGRIADLLVTGNESPDVVDWNVAATHYEQAGRASEAATALAYAADRARRRGALTEARNHLGRSIELVAGAPDGGDGAVDEVALRLRRGFLAMTAEGAGSAEAASDYARCLELAMSDARGDGMFSALISLWAYHLARAELDRAGDVLDVLRQQLHGSREWFRPANRAGYGMLEWFRGHFDPALGLLEHSRRELTGPRVADEVAETWFVPNDPTASIHVHLAIARFMRGDTDGADTAFADGVAVTEELDFPQGPWSGAYGAWLRSWASAERGDLAAAHRDADRVVDLANRHGFDNWTMIGATHQYALTAILAARPGGADPAVAAQALGAMLEMWEALEVRVFLPFYATTVGAAWAAAGDETAARAHYDRADALGESTGMQFYAAETARRRALLATGVDESVNRLRSALELARAQGTRPFEVRIALDLHDRIGTDAIPELRCAVDAHSEGASYADLDAARAPLVVPLSRPGRRVAILGGGMAGITTAWRLSEPGWRDELDSITVYQRGWRLGGKGASSRGAHGRIEEHGLHLWLGYYENAFRVLRECYAELDRPTTDPTARLRTWRDAMLPTEDVGLEHAGLSGWQHWVGRFTPNDELPGSPEEPAAGMTVVDYVRRALPLVADFLESLTAATEPRGVPAAATATLLVGAPIVALAGVLEATAQLDAISKPTGLEGVIRGLDRTLGAVRTSVRRFADEDADVLRTWHLISVMAASVRGVLADGLLTHPDGFRAANDEDFVDWILRHGAAPEVAEFAFIRGLYDLVFADLGPERAVRGVAAGTAVFMTSKMFFEYKGAIFWKMAAGMGDVVFAPMYEALRRRGVDFEFFHRIDQLHVSADGLRVDSITMGRQAALAGDRDRYEPLVRVGDLPGFPAGPLGDQLCDPGRLAGQDLESHWCTVPDVETRVLQRGEDFDDVVLAIPVGMAALVCEELVAARPEWARMTEGLATTATQALQLWLRPREPELGWRFPGATVSAYAQPFNTWASMDQLTALECWPADDRPGTIAYFCGALDAPEAPASDVRFPDRQRARVAEHARQFVERDLVHLLPGAAESGRVRWDQLCGADGATGPEALANQYLAANVDPSDRYVQCAPGTDRVRLRADESGFDNLFLAGDWTDNGLNAGCIEAATLSGLQAANAVLGRSRLHRIAGSYMG